MQAPLLELHHITKRFGNFTANDDISLSLDKGEILALLGENGAGKTTLMNILFGHYVADDGEIFISGKKLSPGSPRASLAAGLGMVHQHFTLADNMTVLDNITLGTEPNWAFSRKKKEALAKLKDLCNQYELDVYPQQKVKSLTVGQRQRVEILKALYRETKILILDEPTAVLTPQESDHLFITLNLLVKKGLAIIFITHKMREVMAASTKCAVLRQGRLTYTSKTAKTSAQTLAEEMVGGSIPVVSRSDATPGEALFELKSITVQEKGRNLLSDINLCLRSGEIIGIAGVSGNGQGSLADLISGLLTPISGGFLIRGKELKKFSPAIMHGLGIGRIPEDRNGVGLIGDMSIGENAILENYRKSPLSQIGIIKHNKVHAWAQGIVEKYDVRCVGLRARARTMSGGNIQKLILGRVLEEHPEIILANQPTWGLDVGATAFVHKNLIAASRIGAGVLVISEDLDELLLLADVIQVMYQGTLSPPIVPELTSAAEIGLAMSGQRDIMHSLALKRAQQ